MKRVRDADRRREASLHEVEYTNKMATIGRLAAGVAHEINNPLAIINEKAGLLQDLMELGDEFPRREKVSGLVSSIIASVERASRVTHRLLGFSRHVDVRCETIDLAALIHEVLGFLEREAAYRGVEMTITRGADLPAIDSDRGQLQQVFLNIVNNALAAVQDRTGRIEIALSRTDQDRVQATITDNGAGIERANLSKIFEPFFTTKKGYGTGLGLSVTYGILKKLGGTITVDSEPGQWTTFTVSVPIKSCVPGEQADV
jgi:signal transduction histidine kinase